MSTLFSVGRFVSNFKANNIIWPVTQCWMCNTPKGYLLEANIRQYIKLSERMMLNVIIAAMLDACLFILSRQTFLYAQGPARNALFGVIALITLVNSGLILQLITDNIKRRPLYALIRELAQDYYFLHEYTFFQILPHGRTCWRADACDQAEGVVIELAIKDIRCGVFPIQAIYQIPDSVDTEFIRVHRVAHKFRLVCAFPEVYLEMAQMRERVKQDAFAADIPDP